MHGQMANCFSRSDYVIKTSPDVILYRFFTEITFEEGLQLNLVNASTGRSMNDYLCFLLELRVNKTDQNVIK